MRIEHLPSKSFEFRNADSALRAANAAVDGRHHVSAFLARRRQASHGDRFALHIIHTTFSAAASSHIPAALPLQCHVESW